MALIKCTECGREISDKAAACIHCGCPITFSKDVPKTADPSRPAAVPADSASRSLTVNFHATVSDSVTGKTSQNIFVPELGRNVEFPIDNTTKVGETIKITLREGSKYDYILFKTASVSRKQQATFAVSSDDANDSNTSDPMAFLNQYFNKENKNAPTVVIEAKLIGPQTATTTVSVFVPEFNRSVNVTIPNSITEGQIVSVTAAVNAAVNGINSPLKVRVGKVTHMDASARSMQSSGADMADKIKAAKRRIYVRPIISLVCSIFFLVSFAGIFLMMFLFPEGGAPDFLMNVMGIGFSVGFLPVFYFKFFPYIIKRYPDPGFFKTRKIMRHLEKRGLLEKAVTEMETCQLVSFGEQMCLSDNFLFPKKKNGIIIPCDELLWVYDSFSNRNGNCYLMLGTEKWGIQCFTRIRGRKQYAQVAAAAIRELQKRNPSILVGETRENKKTYFQYIKS